MASFCHVIISSSINNTNINSLPWAIVITVDNFSGFQVSLWSFTFCINNVLFLRLLGMTGLVKLIVIDAVSSYRLQWP